MVEHVPSGICITNEQGIFEYVNPAYTRVYGYSQEELIGQPFTLVVPPEQHQQAQEMHDTFLAQRKEIPADWTVVNKAGEQLHILASAAYLEDDNGQARKITFVLDITERKQQDAEHAELQQQVIDAQRYTLRELSTPLIPISDRVVIMPLIGTIDSLRAQMIMEALLEGVARHQASLAILDITGVAVVDTQVAQTFILAAQAVRLLGAQVMLTGIQPQIAQTLVQLGVDLSGIQTQSSLQAGIAAALQNSELT
jgi:PAS domain S-box-containing protein